MKINHKEAKRNLIESYEKNIEYSQLIVDLSKKAIKLVSIAESNLLSKPVLEQLKAEYKQFVTAQVSKCDSVLGGDKTDLIEYWDVRFREGLRAINPNWGDLYSGGAR